MSRKYREPFFSEYDSYEEYEEAKKAYEVYQDWAYDDWKDNQD